MDSIFLFIGVIVFHLLIVGAVAYIHQKVDFEISITTRHKVHEYYQYWLCWNVLISPIFFYLVGAGVVV